MLATSLVLENICRIKCIISYTISYHKQNPILTTIEGLDRNYIQQLVSNIKNTSYWNDQKFKNFIYLRCYFTIWKFFFSIGNWFSRYLGIILLGDSQVFGPFSIIHALYQRIFMLCAIEPRPIFTDCTCSFNSLYLNFSITRSYRYYWTSLLDLRIIGLSFANY